MGSSSKASAWLSGSLARMRGDPGDTLERAPVGSVTILLHVLIDETQPVHKAGMCLAVRVVLSINLSVFQEITCSERQKSAPD
jgi:hypothetical protein